MIGVDTNVLMRYLVQDDEAQHRRAVAVMDARTADEPVYLSWVTLLETTWLLRRKYGMPRGELLRAVTSLLVDKTVVIQEGDLVAAAVELASSSRTELADALVAVAGHRAGCQWTYTFDQQAARRLDDLVLVP